MAPGSHTIGGTVRSRAVRELRDRILTGRLAPGTFLDMNAITEEFGTSKTPVREALLQLSYEGLVEVAPRSHVTIIGVGPDDVLDSFELLGTLVGKAAEWAAGRISPQALAELSDLHDSIKRAANDSASAASQASWQFHRAINRAARSPRLLALIRHAVLVVPTNFFEIFPDSEDESNREHRELLDAIAAGDGPLARTLAEEHIGRAGQRLAEWLAGPGV